VEGDLPDTACATTLARYLTTMGNGMAVQATSGATVEELHAIADIALASFPACARAKTAVKDLVD
jgi:hypothetical protein